MNFILHKQFVALLFFSFLFVCVLSGQDIFLLEKSGTGNNSKYYIGDFVKFESGSGDDIVKGKITHIRDSSIVIAHASEFFIKDIDVFYRKRWGFGFLHQLFLKGGAAYLFLLTINGVISSDSGEINEVPFIVAGSLIVAGIAIIPLKSRKIDLKKSNWQLKILKF